MTANPSAPTCRTCTFWNQRAAPKKNESPEHRDWRPCTNTMPWLKRQGGVEVRTLSKSPQVLTAPTATCNGWHPRPGGPA